jgi:DNA (cytosine-5)-methyltransferase 1
MRVLDLFSGIGGFSLGLERAGMRTVAFCEIDPYARAVLRKHWPDVPCFPDITRLTAASLRNWNGYGVGKIDVICGGFPCQDISLAGSGAGLAGERSGLWSEYLRLIREIGPRYVIVENVSALLGRGLAEILGQLAEIGYDAEWHCIPAAYVGAPHRRDRIWIIAYPNSQSQHDCAVHAEMEIASQCVADASSSGRVQRDSDARGSAAGSGTQSAEEWRGPTDSRWWEIEPAVGRVADGVPNRSHRLRALGNAVVPQVVEIIGRAIMRETHG